MLLLAVFINFGKQVAIELNQLKLTWKVKVKWLWKKRFNLNFISARAIITKLRQPVPIAKLNDLRLTWKVLLKFHAQIWENNLRDNDDIIITRLWDYKNCWRTEFLEPNLTDTNDLIILRPDDDREKTYLWIPLQKLGKTATEVLFPLWRFWLTLKITIIIKSHNFWKRV